MPQFGFLPELRRFVRLCKSLSSLSIGGASRGNFYCEFKPMV
jgi:hypothetical protein